MAWGLTKAKAGMTLNFVVVRDMRLHGWKPKGDAVLEVNFDTPLSWPIHWAAGKVKPAKASYLRLMAHGYPGGMRFCKEHITRNTMKMFDKLRGKYIGIDLFACSPAKMKKGDGGKGDGNFLCYRLAQITQSYVRASRHVQWYNKGSGPDRGINFNQWEGTVVTWGPKGNIVKIEESPPAYSLPGP